MEQRTLFCGYRFIEELMSFYRHFPEMQFYKYCFKYFEIKDYYAKFIDKKKNSLVDIMLKLKHHKLCKHEQTSNWK